MREVLGVWTEHVLLMLRAGHESPFGASYPGTPRSPASTVPETSGAVLGHSMLSMDMAAPAHRAAPQPPSPRHLSQSLSFRGAGMLGAPSLSPLFSSSQAANIHHFSSIHGSPGSASPNARNAAPPSPQFAAHESSRAVIPEEKEEEERPDSRAAS